ncbi:MAG: hypothetical protein LC802_01280 [Acidobacteria bacterium]|nr:hypothetical protein [Acidobacteriota bacterium]
MSKLSVLGVTRARDSIRLQNSMRLLASRVEKARLDAIRRHGSTLVEFTTNKTYVITMDFEGTGNATKKRTYSLEDNIVLTNADGTAIATADLPSIDFGWRGGTTQCYSSMRLKNRSGASSTISVTSSGDVTIDSTIGATVSPGTYSAVSQTSDIWSSATVSGTTPTSCDDPCGGCSAVSIGPVGSSPPPGCSIFTLGQQSITIRRNGASTASFTVTSTSADTITINQPDGRTNLQFTPSASQAFAAGASKTFTVTSLNNSWGTYSVKFTSACSSSNIVNAKVIVNK